MSSLVVFCTLLQHPVKQSNMDGFGRADSLKLQPFSVEISSIDKISSVKAEVFHAVLEMATM